LQIDGLAVATADLIRNEAISYSERRRHLYQSRNHSARDAARSCE